MRIYRSVCTYIWQDQRFPYISDDCQLVCFHIFTNPLSTQFGLVRASVEGLAAEKNLNGTWPLDRYAKAFTEGLREGFFEYDEKALLIYFPKYFSAQHPHNHPNNPNVILGWGEWFRNIPESPLKQKCLQNLNEMVISKGKAFQEAFSKAFTEAFTKAALKPLGTEWVNRQPKPKPKPKPKEDKSLPVQKPQRIAAPDAVWIQELKDNPIYTGIDIDLQLRKCMGWCEPRHLTVSRKRFTNWLVRAMDDKPISAAANRPCQSRIQRGLEFAPCNAPSVAMIGTRPVCQAHNKTKETHVT